jgi:hypothetical protein
MLQIKVKCSFYKLHLKWEILSIAKIPRLLSQFNRLSTYRTHCRNILSCLFQKCVCLFSIPYYQSLKRTAFILRWASKGLFTLSWCHWQKLKLPWDVLTLKATNRINHICCNSSLVPKQVQPLFSQNHFANIDDLNYFYTYHRYLESFQLYKCLSSLSRKITNKINLISCNSTRDTKASAVNVTITGVFSTTFCKCKCNFNH